jgi:hypothetical protein
MLQIPLSTSLPSRLGGRLEAMLRIEDSMR